MRKLTREELDVLVNLRDAVNNFAALEQSHPADMEEFVTGIHVLQNIVLSRPATESIREASEDEEDGWPDTGETGVLQGG